MASNAVLKGSVSSRVEK